MADDLFGDRRKALEEEFFRRREAELIARQRSDDEQRAERAALAAASHITDEHLLDQLVALGIRADTLAALSLLPLVEVAWADGKVEDAEKQAILEAARAVGLEDKSTGYRLLEHSLSERPQAQQRNLWRGYIQNLRASMPPEAREGLKADLLQRARTVAEAAGGFLGFGGKVSSKEEALLAEIAAAFND